MRLQPISLCLLLLMAAVQSQQLYEAQEPVTESQHSEVFRTEEGNQPQLVDAQEPQHVTTESPPMKSEVLWTKEVNQQVAVGTRWSMMIYAVDEKFLLDFLINDDSSVLYIWFHFNDGEIIFNSFGGGQEDRLSDERHTSPVESREKFYLNVTLEERGFHILINDYWHEFYYHKQPIDDLTEVIAYGEGLVELTMYYEGRGEGEKASDDTHGGENQDETNEAQSQETQELTDQVKEGDDGHDQVDSLSDEEEALLKSMLAEVQQKVDAQYGRETLDGVETDNVIVDRVLLEDLIAYFKNDQKEEDTHGKYKDGYSNKYGNENYVK